MAFESHPDGEPSKKTMLIRDFNTGAELNLLIREKCAEGEMCIVDNSSYLMDDNRTEMSLDRTSEGYVVTINGSEKDVSKYITKYLEQFMNGKVVYAEPKTEQPIDTKTPKVEIPHVNSFISYKDDRTTVIPKRRTVKRLTSPKSTKIEDHTVGGFSREDPDNVEVSKPVYGQKNRYFEPVNTIIEDEAKILRILSDGTLWPVSALPTSGNVASRLEQLKEKGYVFHKSDESSFWGITPDGRERLEDLLGIRPPLRHT